MSAPINVTHAVNPSICQDQSPTFCLSAPTLNHQPCDRAFQNPTHTLAVTLSGTTNYDSTEERRLRLQQEIENIRAKLKANEKELEQMGRECQ